MCELAKRITVPVSMDFMSVSSYGNGTATSGAVKIIKIWMNRSKTKMSLLWKILSTQGQRCII